MAIVVSLFLVLFPFFPFFPFPPLHPKNSFLFFTFCQKKTKSKHGEWGGGINVAFPKWNFRLGCPARSASCSGPTTPVTPGGSAATAPRGWGAGHRRCSGTAPMYRSTLWSGHFLPLRSATTTLGKTHKQKLVLLINELYSLKLNAKRVKTWRKLSDLNV